MEGLAETGSGGHLVPLLNGVGGGLDASLLRRLYAGHFLARWGARYVRRARLRAFPSLQQLIPTLFGRIASQHVGVLGGAVHDPHLAGLAAFRGRLRRRRGLLRRRLRPHGWHPRREAHISSGSSPY